MGWDPPTPIRKQPDEAERFRSYVYDQERQQQRRGAWSSLLWLCVVMVLALFALWIAATGVGTARGEVFAPGAHPRVAQYATSRSWGPPLLRGDGSLDSTTLRRLARYPLFTVEADPVYSSRPDIMAALRHYNAGARVLCYTLAGYMWVGPDWVPQANDRTHGTAMFRRIRDTGGFLYGTDGAVWFDNFNVNLGNRATAESLATLFANLAASRLFDGLFLDCFSSSVGWTDGSMGRRLDVQRAGFATLAQMDSARRVNCQRIVDRIRAAAPAGFLVVTNGTGPESAGTDGAMLEGVGSLWTWAQARAFSDTTRSAWSWAKSEGGWGNPYSAPSCRAARRLLAAAAMGDAWAAYCPDRDLSVVPYFGTWWFDEYAVTPYPWARADTTGAFVGWLGAAGDTLVVAWADPVRRIPSAGMRRFAGGAVLWNDTGAPVTFDMRVTFKRITGTRDPVTNNGREGQSFTVPPLDALFLVRKPRPTLRDMNR